MATPLDFIYYGLRKKEIEKAFIKIKRVKIDTILQTLTKLCWKHNIQYEVFIKTSDLLIIKLIGHKEMILFKYHKATIVARNDIDAFMNLVDENKASKGIYITTGEFSAKRKINHKSLFSKRDIIFEDGSQFIRRQLGLKGMASDAFKGSKLKFFKYIPQ